MTRIFTAPPRGFPRFERTTVDFGLAKPIRRQQINPAWRVKRPSLADMTSIINVDEQIVVASRVRVCERTGDRLRGLIGTRKLDPSEAVWIRPCNSIHTFFMLMTIDVAFLDSDLRVVKVIPWMTAWRVCLPVAGADSVLEGPGGMIERAKLRRGTRLAFTD